MYPCYHQKKEENSLFTRSRRICSPSYEEGDSIETKEVVMNNANYIRTMQIRFG